MAKKKAVDIDDHPQLPDMEDQRDEALIRAAKRYQGNKRALTAAHSDLHASHDALTKLMEERGIKRYKYKKLEIIIDTKDKAKVKEASDEPSENGDE